MIKRIIITGAIAATITATPVLAAESFSTSFGTNSNAGVNSSVGGSFIHSTSNSITNMGISNGYSESRGVSSGSSGSIGVSNGYSESNGLSENSSFGYSESENYGSSLNNNSEETSDKGAAWLKESIQKMDFSGFDTSAFSVISTDTESGIVDMFTKAAKEMTENGWGKIPTDGVFSSANGFSGYKLTKDMTSTAAELFQSTFSNVYNAMKDGSFMGDLSTYDKSSEVNNKIDLEAFKQEGQAKMKNLGDMTEMTNMVNMFSGTIDSEMSEFSGDDLFASAIKGIRSVDIEGQIKKLSLNY